MKLCPLYPPSSLTVPSASAGAAVPQTPAAATAAAATASRTFRRIICPPVLMLGCSDARMLGCSDALEPEVWPQVVPHLSQSRLGLRRVERLAGQGWAHAFYVVPLCTISRGQTTAEGGCVLVPSRPATGLVADGTAPRRPKPNPSPTSPPVDWASTPAGTASATSPAGPMATPPSSATPPPTCFAPCTSLPMPSPPTSRPSERKNDDREHSADRDLPDARVHHLRAGQPHRATRCHGRGTGRRRTRAGRSTGPATSGAGAADFRHPPRLLGCHLR